MSRWAGGWVENTAAPWPGQSSAQIQRPGTGDTGHITGSLSWVIGLPPSLPAHSVTLGPVWRHLLLFKTGGRGMESFHWCLDEGRVREEVSKYASVLRQTAIPWRMIPSKISTLQKLRNPSVDQYPYTWETRKHQFLSNSMWGLRKTVAAERTPRFLTCV